MAPIQAIRGGAVPRRAPRYRQDVTFEAYGETISAWLYPSKYSTSPNYKGPAMVLAHGLGAVKEMRLDAYSELFYAEGYTCLAFDYRCNGESTGLPRGLVNVTEQLKDWKMALKYVRSLPYVRREDIGIFGTSFGGGNAIRVAARDPTIKATISQCPFTSGVHSSLTTGLAVIPELAYNAIKDILFGTKKKPHLVRLVAMPGQAALLNAPGAMEGCHALVPSNYSHPNSVPARFVLEIPFMRPGAYTSKIKGAIMFGICGNDTVAPPKPTLAFAKKAKRGTIKYYPDMGHFEIYLGKAYEEATADYLNFLREHLPIEPPPPRHSSRRPSFHSRYHQEEQTLGKRF